MPGRAAHIAARALMLPLQVAARALPERARRELEDRLFYAIFQLTRATNDAYPRRRPGPASPGEGRSNGG